jgi:hypothetical protein
MDGLGGLVQNPNLLDVAQFVVQVGQASALSADLKAFTESEPSVRRKFAEVRDLYRDIRRISRGRRPGRRPVPPAERERRAPGERPPENGLRLPGQEDPPRAALRTLRELSNRNKYKALNPLLLRTTMIQLYDRTLAAQATTDFEFPDSRKFGLGDRYLKVGTEVMRVGLLGSVDAEI